MSIGRQALVFGASGLVGGQLVQELLASGLYKQVTVWVRRPLALDHPLLRQEIGDLQPDRLEEKPGVFQAEDVYCCLGTTIKKAGSEEAFARVDRELPAAAARLAARQGAQRWPGPGFRPSISSALPC
ncbi:NAD-dependent epimerase/dehydratase family protein [Paenibacillus aurantius]|uniref:NAD-dependent epimerase/dehydratase family protein n=1 Tax=Paenibacillus aurantius TaxID=2918900 RepID=A0AA96LC05_9BACL|nr:NAD-dependent epimerase/dehydratase family protein [Paenibacillus aurantius]WNQ10500.1 NAD-dependent epimerase/dehydratase family protein [Paenibacillus aurantius]